MENTNKCSGCSRHCDRNNLQCGKGRAYFSSESEAKQGRFHGLFGRKRHGHKHHRPESPAGSLPDLLAKCGHRLFHSGDATMFDVLTEDEANTLTMLLNKIITA